MKRMNQTGFTLIELLISTAIFSIILILISFGLLQIGRSYMKGVNSIKAQEAARTITDDVSRAIQFSGGQILGESSPNPPASPNFNRYCVGDRMYSYVLGKQVIDSGAPSASQTRHALVVENILCNAATPPVPINSVATILNDKQRELIPANTRLAKFLIQDLSDNNYRIIVRVVYGDEDLLDDALDANGNPGTDGILDSCKNERAGSQFCAVSELSTVVQKRIQ